MPSASVSAKAPPALRGFQSGLQGTASCNPQTGCPCALQPVASSRGRGVTLVPDPAALPLDKQCIVQQYVANPATLGGFKVRTGALPHTDLIAALRWLPRQQQRSAAGGCTQPLHLKSGEHHLPLPLLLTHASREASHPIGMKARPKMPLVTYAPSPSSSAGNQALQAPRQRLLGAALHSLVCSRSRWRCQQLTSHSSSRAA